MKKHSKKKPTRPRKRSIGTKRTGTKFTAKTMLVPMLYFIGTIMFCVALFFSTIYVFDRIEDYKAWLKEEWVREFTINFTRRPYIPKAVTPTQYHGEYDIILISPNASIGSNVVVVPPPGGGISIQEAIRDATCIMEPKILADLEKQFRQTMIARGWKNLAGTSSYTVTFNVPRRALITPADFYLVMNVPTYRISLYQNYKGTRTHIKSYPIIVGHPLFQTPLGYSSISALIWNPDWSPPASEWAKKYKRLGPGGINPLGKAGMKFAGSYMIHGSEYPPRQAISHGCVRMRNEDVLELVWFLQNKFGKPISARLRNFYMMTLTPAYAGLHRAVPLYVTYEPFETYDGKLHIAKDIYDKKQKYTVPALAGFLRSIGVRRPLDMEKLRIALEAGAATGVEVPLQDLVVDPQRARDDGSFWGRPDPRASMQLVPDKNEPAPMAVDLNRLIGGFSVKQKEF